MTLSSENPPAGGADGLEDDAFPGGNCSQTYGPNLVIPQAENYCSPAVTASIKRNHERLLEIKRGSLASLSNMAGAHLDATMESIENVDDEAMLKHGALFLETGRAIAALLKDFRKTRKAFPLTERVE